VYEYCHMKIYKTIETNWVRSLRSGAMLIHPTDTSWAIGTSAFSKKGFKTLSNLNSESTTNNTPPTILIDSILHLKKYVYQLHPRVETMLSYHHRPISILYSEIKCCPTYLLNADGCAALCIVQDPRIKKLIQKLKYPIIYNPIKSQSNVLQTSMQSIPNQLKNKTDFIYHPNGPLFNATDVGKPAVVANVDDQGNLLFH